MRYQRDTYIVSSLESCAPSALRRFAFASLVCSLMTSTFVTWLLGAMVKFYLILVFTRVNPESLRSDSLLMEFLNNFIIVGSKTEFANLSSHIIKFFQSHGRNISSTNCQKADHLVDNLVNCIICFFELLIVVVESSFFFQLFLFLVS